MVSAATTAPTPPPAIRVPVFEKRLSRDMVDATTAMALGLSSYEALVRKLYADQLHAVTQALIPTPPPYWPAPKGGDPLAVLDIQQANDALRRGASADRTAAVLAARILARAHGRGVVRRALRSFQIG